MHRLASPTGSRTSLAAKGALIGLLVIASASASAQAWVDSYAKGLSLAKASDWPMARQSFLNAHKSRQGDSADPTRLPGPITEPRVWRGGAPYSPRFAAAYCAWRWALETSDSDERTRLLKSAIDESAELLKAGQRSSEAYALLLQAGALSRDAGAESLAKETWAKFPSFNWKVDSEMVTQEDRLLTENVRAQLHTLVPQAGGQAEATPGQTKPEETKPTETKPSETKPKPAEQKPPKEVKPTDPPANPDTGAQTGTSKPPRVAPPGAADPGTGRKSESVPPPAAGSGAILDIKAQDVGQGTTPTGEIIPVETKFALLLGTSQSSLAETRQAFGASDIQLVKEALIAHAGYPEANIEVITDPTAEQMKMAAESLAERMPSGSTLFLFYSGGAINLGGTDYLAGSDATTLYQTGSMVKKDTLLESFTRKGARVFSFYQVSRPVNEGRVFGSQIPALGSVSQMMGTLEGGTASSVFVDGKEVGLFALGIRKVLEQFRSSAIPISEFAWQVFYSMRGGKSGLGAIQTPTLPVLTLLESDSRF